ncbi:hypothetical protein [Streptomyces sp. NPDC006551]|uniref:hypothetical protein n=1 Tax=Streptomyces sp. NPDC006551 TaxID=3157178 RepID=UPI0033A708E9
MNDPAPQPDRRLEITVPLPEGRDLVAFLDPDLPQEHSPLRRALRAARIPLDDRD